ncbi:hypothetical protein [Dongshaea marina]|uniref:hypothetical protein n=1 Tax=Dongshaea marina TaxID=2047966 RepID=UPI000D3EDDEB|nr:hypothetical protein [Dongshaea marina]
MADLVRQQTALDKLIKEFESMRGEISKLQDKAQTDPIASEKLMQVQKVLESNIGPNGEMIKSAFSELKSQSLKAQQDLKVPIELNGTPQEHKEKKKCKVRKFI